MDTPHARASQTASLSLSALEAFDMSAIPQYADTYEACASNELRREQGRNHVSSLMIWWFAKNEWSHPIFSELADWALNETGSVHPSQLSHIRNRKMRMMGLKVIEAFGAVNLAVFAYQQDKRPDIKDGDRLIRRLGVRPVTPQIESWIENATVIVNPITKEPVGQGCFVNIYLGYIKIEGVLNGSSDQDPQKMNRIAGVFGEFVQKRIKDSSSDIWSALAIAEACFGDESRAKKFVAVATGLDSYTGLELQRDIHEIAAIVAEITHEPLNPDQLLACVTCL